MGLVRPPQEAKPQPSIEKILNLVIAYNEDAPITAFYDVQEVYMWLNEGCLIEDILPIMVQVIDRHNKSQRPKIKTFSYFRNPVRAARDRRAMQKKQEPAAPINQTEKDAARAKALAWIKEKGIQSTGITHSDWEWYENYKAGKILPAQS